jgi:peptidoglycan/LPS O-acetylase OafA/YrhL
VLYSLQIGRALAAIAVVIHHAIITTQMVSPDTPIMAASLLKLGYLGVDYFFVLSGFIIAHATREMRAGANNAKHYFLSRAIRIYVPYLPVTIGLFAMLFVMQFLGIGNIREPYSIMASLLLVPSNDLPALSAAWTLQHEIMFYALFGACMFLLKDPRFIFAWAIGIVGLLFFTVTDRWLNVVLGIINLEFLFGVAICYIYHSSRLFAARYIVMVLGAALIIFAGYLLIDSEVIHYYRIIAGLGFALIVLGLVHVEAGSDFSKYRHFVFLGSASYAIYLVHAPLLSVLAKLPLIPPHWGLTFSAFVIVSCGVGIVYFKIIETPLMRIARRLLSIK